NPTTAPLYFATIAIILFELDLRTALIQSISSLPSASAESEYILVRLSRSLNSAFSITRFPGTLCS
ncbi:MAG: hypothetical protein QXE24_03470, partial [Desulfurococcaceae archaeon]